VAVRYDKLATNYLAFAQLASIRLWLRVNESTTKDGHTAATIPFRGPLWVKSQHVRAMSALPPKADVSGVSTGVRFCAKSGLMQCNNSITGSQWIAAECAR
jgi:hypothetical protein